MIGRPCDVVPDTADRPVIFPLDNHFAALLDHVPAPPAHRGPDRLL